MLSSATNFDPDPSTTREEVDESHPTHRNPQHQAATVDSSGESEEDEAIMAALGVRGGGSGSGNGGGGGGGRRWMQVTDRSLRIRIGALHQAIIPPQLASQSSLAAAAAAAAAAESTTYHTVGGDSGSGSSLWMKAADSTACIRVGSDYQADIPPIQAAITATTSASASAVAADDGPEVALVANSLVDGKRSQPVLAAAISSEAPPPKRKP